ncbi:MAG: M14 family metallopeptidase [Candidatus Aminicenantales bacterium]
MEKNQKRFSFCLKLGREKTFILILLLTLVRLGLPAQMNPMDKPIPSPEEFFGFTLGSEGKIARWDKIVDYFYFLEKGSPKIKVINMGPTTEGNPFLLILITSAENFSHLDRLQEINSKLSHPSGLTEEEAKSLVREGKAVIGQSMSLHATEIGGTQMTPELAYELITRSDEEVRRILDNAIFLMIPCFNPDGQIMVTDWYRKTLGTEYEGTDPPWLYHKYAGHDNNRDADHLNLIESLYAAKILFRDWIPQAYLDHHHMGRYGARFYIPPYCEPIRPHADPLIWRELSWYGAHIAYKLEEAGKMGILNAAQFPGWGHFGWHWITPFHNIAGMLTESASAQLATPVFVHPEQLRANTLQFPDYEAQTTFPNPWPGGWWRLRDIIEQKKIAALALLDLAARHRETVVWSAYLKAKRQIERGAQGKPAGYIIPASQHDPLTAVKMVNKLLLSGVEIQRARKDFVAGSVIYPQGSFLISLAQPKMGLIRNLLGRTFYPDNEWTRDKEGTPRRPYDLATHTMNEFMGVRVDPVEEIPSGEFEILANQIALAGKVEAGAVSYWLDGRLNDSFRAVNLLLNQGIPVKRVDHSVAGLRAGDFIVAASREKQALFVDVAAQTGVDFKALEQIPNRGVHEVKRHRVGLYQRYWGGNADEGWTRLLFEQFAFPYTSLFDAEIKKGNLNVKYDVILLPHDSPGMITGEKRESWEGRLPSYPPEYQSGLGPEGMEALKTFVKKGGTLITLGDSCILAIEKFGLSIRNITEKLSPKEFFCPGSTVRIICDPNHPLAFGMPQESLALFWFCPAFEVLPSQHNELYETVVRYGERDILQSGWLIGEQVLSKKAGLISASYGEGRVILIGFRVQHRCQTHGTFKLLFNGLIR